MEIFLERVRQVLSGDQGPRIMLLGGTVVLALVVIIDLFGARGRADSVRETLRMVRDTEAGSVSVPSIARVPRDLASEARLAALQAQAPTPDTGPAEALTDDAPEMELAEEAVADDATSESVAENAAEDVPETDTVEAVTAEADAASVTEDATTEDATEIAEAQSLDEAPAEDSAAVEPAPIAADVATADIEVPALLASADLENGQRVWRQCGACHVHDAEQNRGGPHLVNIIGRDIGAAEGWRYSRALSEHGGVWDVESLLAWLENPDTFIPGNQMAFRGLRNEQDRIDVLGFLNASSGN